MSFTAKPRAGSAAISLAETLLPDQYRQVMKEAGELIDITSPDQPMIYGVSPELDVAMHVPDKADPSRLNFFMRPNPHVGYTIERDKAALAKIPLLMWERGAVDAADYHRLSQALEAHFGQRAMSAGIASIRAM